MPRYQLHLKLLLLFAVFACLLVPFLASAQSANSTAGEGAPYLNLFVGKWNIGGSCDPATCCCPTSPITVTDAAVSTQDGIALSATVSGGEPCMNLETLSGTFTVQSRDSAKLVITIVSKTIVLTLNEDASGMTLVIDENVACIMQLERDGLPPVNGGWSAWPECPVSCGGSNVSRTCNNPAPSNGGWCFGPTSTMCNSQPCPVDGGWSAWSTCQVLCNTTAGLASRACDDPAPLAGGLDCVGNSTMNCTGPYRECEPGELDFPPVFSSTAGGGGDGTGAGEPKGEWRSTAAHVNGGWSGWGECNVDCGGGTQNRDCLKSTTAISESCPGEATRACNSHSCLTSDPLPFLPVRTANLQAQVLPMERMPGKYRVLVTLNQTTSASINYAVLHATIKKGEQERQLSAQMFPYTAYRYEYRPLELAEGEIMTYYIVYTASRFDRETKSQSFIYRGHQT